MYIAGELVNNNGVSSVALTFFIALLSAVSATFLAVYKVRLEAKEAKENAIQANEAAEKARKNTVYVSNGFASSVDGKLDGIIKSQIQIRRAVDEQAASLRKHLEWHLTKERESDNGKPEKLGSQIHRRNSQ